MTPLMRAAVIVAPGNAEVREVPVPEPGPGQARVRLEGCGVCASNVPPWEGREWFSYPLEPGGLGHEGWGVVDAVGPGVDTLDPGDRVAMLSQHAYAEYDVADTDQIVPLPPALEGRAFPGEPLGCAVNIFRRSGVAPGDTVAIVGAGFLGALLTRLAAQAGARVIAIFRRADSRDAAQRQGAEVTIPMDDHWRVLEEVKRLTDGRLCDVVIEAVGKQWPLDMAAELTKERGRLIIAGYHQDGLRQVNMQMWNWRGLDVINAHERDPQIYVEGIREAAALVAAGKLDPTLLLTHTFPLERIGEALDAARDRPPGFLKALVTL
jgi:threonine dehydrogenase-like Zn-dependent dehydrogenase